MTNTTNQKPAFATFGHGEGSHPNYRANQDKATIKFGGHRVAADPTNCCCYCGKLVKDAQGKTFLLLSGGGDVITQAEYRDGDLGLYPIGSDCLKKARAAGYKAFNWDGEEV